MVYRSYFIKTQGVIRALRLPDPNKSPHFILTLIAVSPRLWVDPKGEWNMLESDVWAHSSLFLLYTFLLLSNASCFVVCLCLCVCISFSYLLSNKSAFWHTHTHTHTRVRSGNRIRYLKEMLWWFFNNKKSNSCYSNRLFKNLLQ